MRLFVITFVLSCFVWGQLVEEYNEERIQITLKQDPKLKKHILDMQKIMDTEQQSQTMFFDNLHKKMKHLIAYSVEIQWQYKQLLSKYTKSSQQFQKQAMQYSNLQKKWKNTEKMRKNYKDKCDEYANQLNKLNDSLVEQHKKNQNWKNKYENVNKVADEYNRKYSDAYQQCQQAKKDNEDLLVIIANLRNVIAKSQNEKQTYQEKYNKSDQQCQQAKKDNEDLLALIAKLQEEKQQLQNQFQDAKKNYANINDGHQQLQKDKNSLWQENQSLRKELEALKGSVGNWYIVSGKGTARKVAITRAWKLAMMEFLEQNYPEDDFESHHTEINNYLGKNWRKYTVGNWNSPNIVKPYTRRNITIRVRLQETKLLHDVKYLFDKTRDKMEGMQVALISRSKSSGVANDSVFDTLQDKLGQDMVIRDLRAVDTLMKKEAQMLGLPAGIDPAGYVARKFNQVNILVYLDIETYIQKDPYMGNMVYAKMRCSGVWRQTAQELWQFQMISGKAAKPVAIQYVGKKTAKIQAAKNLALAAYKKIRKQIRSRKNILPSQTYELKFVKLGNDKNRIQSAIVDLKDGRKPMLKILPGSYSAGADYFVVKVKWLRSKHTIDDIITHVKEACELNEIEVASGIYSNGVIIFEAPKYNYDY